MADVRTTIYGAALIVAFAAHALGAGSFAGGGAAGAAFWILAAAGCAGVAAGLLLGGPRAALALKTGAALLGAEAFLVPIGLDWIAGRGDLAGLAADHGVALPVAVLVLAGRTVASAADRTYRAFFAEPATATGPVRAQSASAAVLLGLALLLLFQWLVPGLRGGVAGGPGAVVLSAVAGTTVIHEAIMALFFVVLALYADQWRLHAEDRSCLARLRALAAAASGPRFAAALAEAHAARPHQAILHRASERAGLRPPPSGPEAFRRPARRFLRDLVPLMPLLGFLGTVVGLAVAMAELPLGLGTGAGRPDVTASLAGLAVKFETTLLGIMASMIAAGLIALIERREGETQAEADRLVDVALAGGHAPEPAVAPVRP